MYRTYIFPDVYTVGATARLTGLTPETLRAWERRHAAIRPQRDASGRRLYDAATVERLARLRQLTLHGHAIRHLAGLDDDALDRLLAESQQTGLARLDIGVTALLDAITEYRVDELDRHLSVLIATLPVPLLVERILSPLLKEVGNRWTDGRFSVGQEHLVSSLLQSRLLAILNQTSRSRHPQVLFATLPGERHELGVIGAALVAHAAHTPVLYLGAEWPPHDIVRAATQMQSRVVAIGSVYQAQCEHHLSLLATIDDGLPPQTEIWLGGPNASFLALKGHSSRVRVIRDRPELERALHRLRH